MSGQGSLPRTPGAERRHTGGFTRKVKSVSNLLRRESGKSGRDYGEPESMSMSDLHQRLMESVLPLFNGEGIQESIEILNRLVLRLLENGHDAATDVVRALIGIGMAGIRERLISVADDKLLARLSDAWTFFFGSVLPDLQGALEPMNTPQLLLSPTWNPDQHQGEGALVPVTTAHVVRDFILEMYRKEVLAPVLDRVLQAIPAYFTDYPNDRRFFDQYLRLVQLFATISSLNVQDAHQPKVLEVLSLLKVNYARLSRAAALSSGAEYTPIPIITT